MEIKVTFDGNKKVNAIVRNHIVKTDQPINGGGEDTAVSPYELFLASLATCAGIYVKGFCDNRNIPAENITLTQNHEFNEKGLLKKVELTINVPKDFPEKYVDSLIHVASLCKVKQQLMSPPELSVVSKIIE
ncbi:MAG TPA: OsmC family protein [Bacteroidales bacterium]|jgi:ribosomal protein S12 methylthiotransferase accessory factor|nr:OsmC family protein [Bacteroidales bacterium]HOH84666.1 OsmC family protein [Bacteroidales bacterium]HPB25222.1 OsmC family protein [Bacteroidales bacterium]HPI29946.1 OsmC family protein [Bacteroidales bacterium]HQN16029.1 OsmC family protein [Bacteroidales bacterium]